MNELANVELCIENKLTVHLSSCLQSANICLKIPQTLISSSSMLFDRVGKSELFILIDWPLLIVYKVLMNDNGELCGHYPQKIIIIESEICHEDSSSRKRYKH